MPDFTELVVELEYHINNLGGELGTTEESHAEAQAKDDNDIITIGVLAGVGLAVASLIAFTFMKLRSK